MVFEKGYLIKSISAVTNYNSSSCFIIFDMLKRYQEILYTFPVVGHMANLYIAWRLDRAPG